MSGSAAYQKLLNDTSAKLKLLGRFKGTSKYNAAVEVALNAVVASNAVGHDNKAQIIDELQSRGFFTCELALPIKEKLLEQLLGEWEGEYAPGVGGTMHPPKVV